MLEGSNRPRQRRALRRAGFPGAVVLGMALATLSACGPDSHGKGSRDPPAVVVQVATARASDLPRTLSAVGTLTSPETTTVAAEIAGTTVALDIPEGRPVEKGHLLARLDDAETRAAVTVTRARLTNARARLERLRSLHASSVSSQLALDDAVAEFDAARGELDEAETRLRKTAIRAPFAGILGLRAVSRGMYLEAGDPIVEITRMDPLELEFSVPQGHASRLAPGQVVRGTAGSCGPRFEGKVDAIDPRVDPATRSVHLQARVPNPEGLLLPGMAAHVQLVIGVIPGAVVIPREAVVREGARHLVWVLDDEDRARQRAVRLGSFFADGVRVREGVAAGDRVVTAGHQKLRPGVPTRPHPYEPIENPLLDLGRSGPEGSCEG